MTSYVKAFQVIYEHLTLAFWAALVFAMGLGSAFIVVRGHLRFLMRFPLWFASQVERLLSSNRGFMTVFTVIFVFNSAAMFLYMLSGLVEMAPAVIDFLTGMNIGIVFLAKHKTVGETEKAEPSPALSEESPPDDGESPSPGSPPSARQAVIFVGFIVVTALELPCLWISIAMGIGLCHFAQPDGATCMYDIAERAQAYLLVVVPLLAISAMAETISVRLMQTEIGELGA
jgi:hypothetical protein